MRAVVERILVEAVIEAEKAAPGVHAWGAFDSGSQKDMLPLVYEPGALEGELWVTGARGAAASPGSGYPQARVSGLRQLPSALFFPLVCGKAVCLASSSEVDR